MGSFYNPISSLLIRNFMNSIFISADKSLLNFSQNSKALQLLRWLLVSLTLFLLRAFTFLPVQFLSFQDHDYDAKPNTEFSTGGDGVGGGDSAITRALSQLLSTLSDIPVSSRKYEMVRCLAEKIIDENMNQGSEALRKTTCVALNCAFSRTLGRLEAALVERHRLNTGELGFGAADYLMSWAMKAVCYLGDTALFKARALKEAEEPEERQPGCSAEKLAAELLWLAEKLAACGGVEDAVEKWAYASNLARLALSAEPRLQGSLLKVSAFLIKQAKYWRDCEYEEEGKRDRQMRTKMKMLMSWLPLLCRGSSGTVTPVLSSNEKSELEKVLEEAIETLEHQEDREEVLSLWLHHFAYCPSSDWPNLLACYVRWFAAARKLFLLQ